MIAPLLLGLTFGGGLVMIGRSVRPRPVSLAVAVRRTEAPVRHVSGVSTPSASRPWTRRLEGSLGEQVARDLRVLGRSPARHATEKLTSTIALGALPVAGSIALAPIGLAPPILIAVVATIGGIVGGFFLPDLLLRGHATKRRRQFTFALSSYLDLVNVLLAGGAGVETALHATAQAGDGWAFAELNSSLVRATTMRRSPWAALAELGDDLGVEELVELAASIQLAGEEGARIRSSLAAKAAALRGRQMAAIEADAHSASERMGFPTVGMFVGFLALLAYPAVQQIVGS